MLHRCLSPLFCGWKWVTPFRCCHCYSVSFHPSVRGPSTGSSDLNCCSSPIPSPIIWGNLVQFNCWSVCKEELGRKLNCFPGWAFEVQILVSANSLWDYGKCLPKYSSEAIMKSSPTFSPGFSPDFFPSQKLVVCRGHWAACALWRSSAVGTPTLQPRPPRDSSRNDRATACP